MKILSGHLCAAAVKIMLALAALPAPASSTWFFRDDNGAGYGQRDGTSYANAWHLDDRSTAKGHLDWSVMKPGDTLYVCGYHHTGRDRSIRPVISGTAGQPIIIDGNCPTGNGTDRGIMLLANAEFIGGWTGPYNGIYARDYEGSTGGQMIEDTDNLANGTAGLKRLIRRTGLPDASWACGSFSQAGSAAIIYYKPSDADNNGSCDTPHPLYAAGSGSISFNGVSHFVLRNLTLMHQNRLIDLVGAGDIRIENNELRWATERGIRAGKNSDGGRILNNRIHDVQSGIYMENQVDYNNADSMDNWVISGNEIHNVDQDCYYSCQNPLGISADTHAIAFQGGTNNLIERNHIHHVGGEGIIFYATKGQSVSGNTIQYNFIHDVKDLNPDTAAHPERSELGIAHGGSGEEIPENSVNNLVRYNVLSKIDKIGIRLKASKPSSGYSWGVLNNVIHAAGRSSFAFAPRTDSAALQGNVPGFRFRNNISMNPGWRHIEQLPGTLATDTSGMIFTNNLFYPDSTPGIPRYDWAAASHESLAAWSSVSGKAGGIAGNPRFVNPAGSFHWSGSPATITAGGDFRLLAASPAINAGIATAAAGEVDMGGNPVLVQRDIGAYEAPTDLRVAIHREALSAPGSAVYVITVSNAGPGSATGITLSNWLPPGASLQLVAPSQGSCSGSVAVVCSLGNLAANAGATVTLRVSGEGSAINTAAVAAQEFDPDLANNSVSSLASAAQTASGTCSAGCH